VFLPTNLNGPKRKTTCIIRPETTNYTYIYKLLKFRIFSLPILEKRNPHSLISYNGLQAECRINQAITRFDFGFTTMVRDWLSSGFGFGFMTLN